MLFGTAPLRLAKWQVLLLALGIVGLLHIHAAPLHTSNRDVSLFSTSTVAHASTVNPVSSNHLILPKTESTRTSQTQVDKRTLLKGKKWGKGWGKGWGHGKWGKGWGHGKWGKGWGHGKWGKGWGHAHGHGKKGWGKKGLFHGHGHGHGHVGVDVSVGAHGHGFVH